MSMDPSPKRAASRGFFNDAATFVERLPAMKPLKLFSGAVKGLTKLFYNLISKFDKGENLVFMNYGFHHLHEEPPALEIPPGLENVRHQVHMYHRIAGAADWRGRDGLEVGSGRGGGAAFIARHFQPRSMTGVDLSDNAVAFCGRFHSDVANLRFVQGDAEELQFPDESFDIIINVESSLYYPNVEKFFAHVVRLLRPGGHFLYADMRYLEEVEHWKRQLAETKLELLHEEDITKNAKHALALNQEYRQSLVKKYAPRPLRGMLSRFGGADGGRLAAGDPLHGERVYKRFVFRKLTM
ncbi:MAG: Phthiotriol/phenolphthiotriol dimycocerosates methyltransferase [Anaerolineales bacterium]|nr:Phthiotriol/phenolphthiotriol dimycocerosates methyltransferase [Anaerolineales bacterium]